jgi:hypothetical protein
MAERNAVLFRFVAFYWRNGLGFRPVRAASLEARQVPCIRPMLNVHALSRSGTGSRAQPSDRCFRGVGAVAGHVAHNVTRLRAVAALVPVHEPVLGNGGRVHIQSRQVL